VGSPSIVQTQIKQARFETITFTGAPSMFPLTKRSPFVRHRLTSSSDRQRIVVLRGCKPTPRSGGHSQLRVDAPQTRRPALPPIGTWQKTGPDCQVRAEDSVSTRFVWCRDRDPDSSRSLHRSVPIAGQSTSHVSQRCRNAPPVLPPEDHTPRSTRDAMTVAHHTTQVSRRAIPTSGFKPAADVSTNVIAATPLSRHRNNHRP
jgi:hypothetical protein